MANGNSVSTAPFWRTYVAKTRRNDAHSRGLGAFWMFAAHRRRPKWLHQGFHNERHPLACCSAEVTIPALAPRVFVSHRKKWGTFYTYWGEFKTKIWGGAGTPKTICA